VDDLNPAKAATLAQQAARACVGAPRAMDEGVVLLSELALSKDAELARIGADAIFRQVVETLGDGFEPRLCDIYIQFFAKVLQHARGTADWLDRRLRQYGLMSEDDLVERAGRVRQVRPARAGGVNKILVLSRVTLGADVAVTSVILGKLLQRYPEAEIKLLGSAKSALLFAGEPRVTSRVVEYPRGGGLLERLRAWERLAEVVREETLGRWAGECLVVDPDSRLTQLGMLPVVDDEGAYCFWESRGYTQPGLETLGELAGAWADEVWGAGDRVFPWVSLALQDVAAARQKAGGQRWASVNLGVGDNVRKRVAGEFEERLLRGLVEAGWRIFLDTGGGGEETARVEALVGCLGTPAIETWRGSLAGFGALIGASRLYVGYDSACQHLAAALGVPVINIFAGHSSPRMVERWRPSGRGKATMVVVDGKGSEPEQVLARVLEAAQ
jgi:ADP-heptose:LPS heptosyltransferase